MSALKELTDIAGNITNPALQAWKEEGKKVVGYFCSYVPEELLYAADIVPYRVRAAGCKDTSAADVYMSHLNCTFMRSCLQYAIDNKLDFIDGIVLSNSCDHARRMYDLLKEKSPVEYQFLHMLSVPHKITDTSIELYKDAVTDFKEDIEKSFGVTITDERIKDAIEVYNETRSLLAKVYELRKQDNPPLKGEECISVSLAGMMMPKGKYNELLKQLLEELKTKEPVTDHEFRIMLSGSGGCDNPDYYKIIEELGGLIVTDSLCVGTRYFWHPVEIKGDLIASLAESYLRRPSCPAMVDSIDERSQFIKDMVNQFNVDGVVFQRMRYCDLWGGAVLNIRTEMKEADIPFIEIEREYALTSTGQLKTRIQAFMERIRG
jgi:bzd-type benzoyl-CoA reductase N subunit